MKSTKGCVLVLVTAPDVKTARNLARLALEARLIACANLLRNIESHYWWKGKIEKSPEALLVMKTTSSAVAGLEKLVLANHPYDTPEFVVMNIHAGTDRYLEWILGEVKR
ncbi:MAG: divalent-cation tolerance protein CutA [Verrucomicrobiota bacterium]|nr:divalent-cation tolerance protein CutA [Verrucomicrobiota bacterium]